MKKEIIFGIGGLVVGGIVGFVAGYKLTEKKVREDNADVLDREIAQIHADDEAKKEAIEKEKAHYEQMVADMRYQTEDEEDRNEAADESEDNKDEQAYDDDLEDPDDIHTDEVDVTRELPKKHKKPKVLGEIKYDEDDPDTDYPEEDLYYYMESAALVDDNGQPVNETDTIGNRLRQSGYMSGNGTLNDVWVRNYEQETDYLVHRKFCAIEDEFTTEEQDE